MSPAISDFRLLHELPDLLGQLHPDRVIIDEGDRTITHGALRDAMNHVATILREANVGPNDRVGFLIDNSIEAVIAILGTLRAGGCYVPITSDLPANRVASIIGDSEMKVLITVSTNLLLLAKAMEEVPAPSADSLKTLLVLDRTEAGKSKEQQAALAKLGESFERIAGWAEIISNSGEPGPCPAISDDLAYIIFTSGTTGHPKGTMLRHRNVMAFLKWVIEKLGLTVEDRIANHSKVTFDVSVMDIFGALFTGATLCPVTKEADRVVPGRFIKERKITVWSSVPSAMRSMVKLGYLNAREMPSLRCGVFAGEAFPTSLAQAWLKFLPHVSLINAYGPTETAVLVAWFEIGVDGPFDASRPVPIGYPCPDTRLPVLKFDSDNVADANEIGRLFIGGPQVCAGYWRKPDLTAAAFRSIPSLAETNSLLYDTGDLAFYDERGILHYVGRSDTQIKISGHRIELLEIEMVLQRLPEIDEAIVLAIGSERNVLVAAVSCCGDQPSGFEQGVIDHCRKQLPHYMVPKSICILDSIPLNSNGKTDREAALKLVQGRVDGVPGRRSI